MRQKRNKSSLQMAKENLFEKKPTSCEHTNHKKILLCLKTMLTN